MLGPEHPTTLKSGNHLAVQLGKLGRHAEAAELHQHVWNSRQQVLGPAHPDTLSSGSELASELGELGRHEEAAEVLQCMRTARCVLLSLLRSFTSDDPATQLQRQLIDTVLPFGLQMTSNRP